MLNRFLSYFQTGNNEESQLSLLDDKPVDDTSNDDIIIDMSILSSNQTIPITPENDGSFAIFSNEITSHIISFLDIHSMAKFAQTNRHLHDVTENTIVMIDENEADELTGEKERVPVLMIDTENTGEERPATYADIRVRLFDEVKRCERLNEISNDMHYRIVKKDPMCTSLSPHLIMFIIGAALGLTTYFKGESIGLSEGETIGAMVAIKMATCISGCVISKFNFNKYSTLKDEESKLKNEITPEISNLLRNA
ncbi:MAG: hypothetical protein A3F13_09930 [Gammaproteobacteria bacterium RIFCSPHIGHO2_12_FULL_40_19]|nr:MAG: hypothetical protein A3F13_09930 [Gammaproteobacteria bacterium RIFCSPHIGHO2_12_FULL_40_19]